MTEGMTEREVYERRIRRAAEAAHEMNRMWCLLHGDMSQVPWGNVPTWQAVSAIDGVKAIVEGRVKGPEDSHKNWMQHKTAAGWVYGEEKDPEKKTHPCMVPYAELSAEQRVKDTFFWTVVRAFFPEVP